MRWPTNACQSDALVDVLVRQVLTTFVQVVPFEGHEDVQWTTLQAASIGP